MTALTTRKSLPRLTQLTHADELITTDRLTVRQNDRRLARWPASRQDIVRLRQAPSLDRPVSAFSYPSRRGVRHRVGVLFRAAGKLVVDHPLAGRLGRRHGDLRWRRRGHDAAHRGPRAAATRRHAGRRGRGGDPDPDRRRRGGQSRRDLRGTGAGSDPAIRPTAIMSHSLSARFCCRGRSPIRSSRYTTPTISTARVNAPAD